MEQDELPQHHRQQQQQQSPDGDAAGQGSVAAADGAAAAAGDNRSKADLLRAKLGGKAAGAGAPAGNRSAADALRARLGGKAPPAAAADAAAGGPEVVHLPLVDAAGRAAPGAFGRETAADAQRALEAAAGGRVAKRVQRYGADGTRERYFADDDSTDLQVRAPSTQHSVLCGDSDCADWRWTISSSLTALWARPRACWVDANGHGNPDCCTRASAACIVTLTGGDMGCGSTDAANTPITLLAVQCGAALQGWLSVWHCPMG